MIRDEEPRLGPTPPSGFEWLASPTRPDAAASSDEDGEGGDDATQSTTCPRCGAMVGAQSFCESCGAAMRPDDRVDTADDRVDITDERGDTAGAHVDADADAHVQNSGRDADGMLVLGARPTHLTHPVHPAHSAHEGQPGASSPEAPEGATAGATEGWDGPPQIDVSLPLPTGGICPACGGTYDGDGYCEHCGVKAPDPRQHFEIAAGPWVGGVCDRGVRHAANEDAVALHAEPSAGGGMRAGMVVCDGVSTAPRSAHASLAAARAAVGVLSASRARGLGVREALIGALAQRLEAAADAANEAVVAVGELPPGPDEAPPLDGYEGGGPSCTFVAAAVEDGLAVIGNVGDSRAYWFPDEGQPLLLTVDDSWAAEAIRAGADRAEAESGPHAHTITRWLGPDAPDHTPVTAPLEVSEPGWLLLCSDGLWNYASEPDRLAAVFAQAAAEVADADPVRIAQRLVEWAIEQGGHDNITAALARLIPAPRASDVDAFDVPSQEPETTGETTGETSGEASGEARMEQPPGVQPAGDRAAVPERREQG